MDLAFSDSEPITTFAERPLGPVHHTETGHVRSSLRTSVPPSAKSNRRPPSPSSTNPSLTKVLNGEQPPSPRDTRRY
ncbi:unnamed protein product [Rodentolepis nana]|uniref:Uncharacterized protein n=1 Tax=Rodentolepis nana TaxID=102285 RepID=A0A0R3TWD9_RODNA|nr:unnamed protein product [Rodentolepis nana]